MGVSAEDIDFAVELFFDLGGITTRKMMGGLCLYRDGVIFAILNPDGSIWLKGGGAFQAVLEDAGCTRWTYTRKDGSTTEMPYWSLPDSALDDPEQACDWARCALDHL
jgi:DNA transformation protein